MDPDIGHGRVTHGNTPQADLAEAAQAVDLKRSWKGAKLLKGLRLGAGLAGSGSSQAARPKGGGFKGRDVPSVGA